VAVQPNLSTLQSRTRNSLSSDLALHLRTEVWSEVESWTHHLDGKPGSGFLISDWWEKELAQLFKKARRTKAAVMIYTA